MDHVMKLPKCFPYYMRSITGGIEGLGKRLLKARRKTTSFAMIGHVNIPAQTLHPSHAIASYPGSFSWKK